MGLLSENEREIEETFRDVHEVGISLLYPPSSTKELLKLLDKSEKLMAKMEQSSSEQTKQALFPIMRALKSPGIFRSPNMDVQMSVLSCISYMIRVTAPDAPYNDYVLKEFFRMLHRAFASLSEISSSRSYVKAASILEIAAEVKFLLLMLDLQLDKLVIEMFQLFLKTISSDHSNTIFNNMESIMTMLVDESEYISLELLSSLLASLQMDNQNFSLASCKLSERVLKNCAAKLQPYIKKAVHSSLISLDDYFQIVGSICESGHVSEEDCVGGSSEIDVTKISALNDGCLNKISRALEEATMRNGSSPKRNEDTLLTDKSSKTLEPCHLNKIMRTTDADDITVVEELDSMKVTIPEMDTNTTPKKRNWKPNTKTLPDEGYSHYWESTEKKTRCRKSHEKGFGGPHSSRKTDLPSTEDQRTELLVSEAMAASSFSQNNNNPEGGCRRRGRPKKNPVMLNENGGISMTSASKVDLVNPLVKMEILESADVCLEKEHDNTSCLEPNQDLSVRDECVVKDTPKRRRKRKPTVEKEEASTMVDVDKQLIGKKIKVWWPLDKKFYFGVVHSFDPESRKHKVLYTDGEEETLNLKEERWELIGVHIPRDGEREADLPKPDASSSIPPKRKYIRKSWSAEQAKTGPSPKRRRPRSKRVEVDSEPKDHVINVRVDGQTSTPETVIISKVESSQKPDVSGPGSSAPEAEAVSNAALVEPEAVSPRHGSESGGAEVPCFDQ